MRSREEFELKVPPFSNHNRRAKRRMLAIMNAKGEKPRNAAYVDLLKITEKVLGYARNTVKMIKNSVIAPSHVALLADIKHYAELTEKVIDQTHRRVVLIERATIEIKVKPLGEIAPEGRSKRFQWL